ncbi:chemotaxis protein CheV [Lachnospiraceae bacterium]|uniref:chemotaxis protein n=1 Tax=Extibacter sp. GGCC_0201 TaxID=2731209 RepID=UPI001AA19C0D|nr:chemotaxis protein [Extibacter sp. GGCC_0201]MBO1719904.1 chemotaxis protein CheV [Extibacter sp. GGCC_0201]BDF35671.1 chemotaxis protein CheV [Lachnospiraceae bacterium]BDF39673.1 chemotaxis protein CheV [Lachnospiraceae bacterium]
MANTEILLESGTNEIEIMEFTIYDELYGINVAKVREIMMTDKIKPVPHSHDAVEGIFKPRDIMLTVVDLPYYLTGQKTEPQPKDLFMVTNFNQMHIAFRVHTVVGIQRISWADIKKPDKTLNGGEEGLATGIAQCGKELITILDFEKIVADIAPETGIQLDEVESFAGRNRSEYSIVLAEDSVLLSRMIETALTKSGYSQIYKFNNGQEAWNYLSQVRNEEVLDDKVSLIITDIEMPQMDGHRLTKLVKEDDRLKKIPLIIFSSLINPEMEIKGRELGADEQLSKPEIGHLVAVMDHLLQRGRE